jgi:hypothetical protein
MREVEVPDPANSLHRRGLVDQVREMLEARFAGDWNDRCPDVACHTIVVLREYGLTGYRIAAGRVEEANTDPPVVLFEGTYTGSAKSEYHTWVVGQDDGILDFSVVPQRYGAQYLWEPYELAPRLKYIEIKATTEAVERQLTKRYGGACT